MARPRIFVSSTYYDLKHVRSQLEIFIESLGYDGVLSEKGEIAYSHEVALDESCYREVRNCDLYVIVIGGRYGSEASSTSGPNADKKAKSFHDRYESITKLEYKAAVEVDIPIYILIERSVYSEFYTFQRNRDSDKVNYAHVDSVNVFRFLEEILAQPRNNPIQTFDRFGDIQDWLREQWAGLFREMLQKKSSQQQLASLAAQVKNLSEINTTLKRYLEEVVFKLSPDSAASLIRSEDRRLDEAQEISVLEKESVFAYITHSFSIPRERLRNIIREANSVKDFDEQVRKLIRAQPGNSSLLKEWSRLVEIPAFLEDVNRTRALMGLIGLDLQEPASREGSAKPKRSREPKVTSTKAIKKRPANKSVGADGKSRRSTP